MRADPILYKLCLFRKILPIEDFFITSFFKKYFLLIEVSSSNISFFFSELLDTYFIYFINRSQIWNLRLYGKFSPCTCAKLNKSLFS